MDYDNAVTAAHTAQVVQQERESGIIDRRYYRGIPAIIKLVQVVSPHSIHTPMI